MIEVDSRRLFISNAFIYAIQPNVHFYLSVSDNFFQMYAVLSSYRIYLVDYG